MNHFIRFSFFTFFICATFLMMLNVRSAEARVDPKYASIVVDADTGLILYQYEAQKLVHPASLVKMMTLLMTFEAIEQGRLKLRDKIHISPYAASMVPSKLGLPAGSSIRVEDAIYSLVTKSANDIAVALAERLGGTERRFADVMTYKARALGMARTRFMNASGLYHEEQVTTARDMAILSRYLMTHYPRYYHYFSTRKFSYKGKTYMNHNKLIGQYDGMDGLKTGYISASGYNLAASAKRDGKRIIGVVFGGKSGSRRNALMVRLLDRGFESLDNVVYASVERKIPVPTVKPVPGVTLAAITPAAGGDEEPQWKSLSAEVADEYEGITGQGDTDPENISRVETGLLAMMSMKEKYSNQGPWAVQIGAFKTEKKTNEVIQAALGNLPDELNHAEPYILPAKRNAVYRGRLRGFTKAQADQACRVLKDCFPVKAE